MINTLKDTAISLSPFQSYVEALPLAVEAAEKLGFRSVRDPTRPGRTTNVVAAAHSISTLLVYEYDIAAKVGATIIMGGPLQLTPDAYHDVAQAALSRPVMFVPGELDGIWNYFDTLVVGFGGKYG